MGHSITFKLNNEDYELLAEYARRKKLTIYSVCKTEILILIETRNKR